MTRNKHQFTQINREHLLQSAIDVLQNNTHGNRVVPAQGLYPHMVLWDSCFIAIGQSNYDIAMAKQQVRHFLDAQWKNGMVPHIIFNQENKYWWDRWIWRSWISPLAPKGIATSGITQPPMLAEAITKIGSQLDYAQKLVWYEEVYDKLLAYHQWLYEDRDLYERGLIFLVHPWETGLDNAPAWLRVMQEQPSPLWIELIERLNIDQWIERFRWDRKYVDSSHRSSTVESLRLYELFSRIRRHKYDVQKVTTTQSLLIEDVSYNSILIHANKQLVEIARFLKKTIPTKLYRRMQKTETSLEDLWDATTKNYFSRDVHSNLLVKEPSIASLMPLYSGSIDKARAKQLVQNLENHSIFNSQYPIPSVPMDSSWFQPNRYWQGPTWINTNWFIIKGLYLYGYDNHAKALMQKTIGLVAKSGFNEYFNPLTGNPVGVSNFSWSAALIIDLLKNEHV